MGNKMWYKNKCTKCNHEFHFVNIIATKYGEKKEKWIPLASDTESKIWNQVFCSEWVGSPHCPWCGSKLAGWYIEAGRAKTDLEG